MPDDLTPPADPATQTGSPTAAAASALTIPDAVTQQYPDLIGLIKASESMNDEERQYWINILPIMTPEQVENLRGILANERDQLAAIDAKYAKEIEKVGEEQFLKQAADERRKKAEQRTQAEQDAAKAEGQSAEDLLKQIETV